MAVFCLAIASRAKSRPYSRLLLEKSGVSGELRYFAVAASASPGTGMTRPPNPTGRPCVSRIENSTRPRKRVVMPGPLGDVCGSGRRFPGFAAKIACRGPGPRSIPSRAAQSPEWKRRTLSSDRPRSARYLAPGRRRGLSARIGGTALRPRPSPGGAASCLRRAIRPRRRRAERNTGALGQHGQSLRERRSPPSSSRS